MKKYLFLVSFLSFFFFNTVFAAVYTQNAASNTYSNQGAMSFVVTPTYKSSTFYMFLNNASNTSGNGTIIPNETAPFYTALPNGYPYATGTYGIIGVDVTSTNLTNYDYSCGTNGNYSTCLTEVQYLTSISGSASYNTSTYTIYANTPTSSPSSATGTITQYQSIVFTTIIADIEAGSIIGLLLGFAIVVMRKNN